MTHISVINTFYLLHISATFLLNVSVYLTPSSGRTYDSSLLKTTCCFAALVYGTVAMSQNITDTTTFSLQ
jgi:hypothetical protein